MSTDLNVIQVSIQEIIPNKDQPRKVFNESSLKDLSNSIKRYGIINPILVRKKEDKYEIIAGERRYRAAKMCGLKEVPVIVKTASSQEMAELALIENLQRQDLSSIEEAKSYEDIIKMGNLTQQDLAERLGKSQAAIANKIRLLSLPEKVKEALAKKKISERHARSLLTVKDDDEKLNILDKIIKEKLTVKETENLINQSNIDEEEVKKAISDIMKSLNIKEEKEDDKMNNGNFFPNFDNNSMQNNTSLNSMNMQSMIQQPMQSENTAPAIPQPTLETPVPPIINTPTPTESPAAPTIELPTMEPISNPEPIQPMQPAEPVAAEAPVFPNMDINIGANISAPEPTLFTNPTEPTMVPQDQPQIPIVNDTPLFNPNAEIPTPGMDLATPVIEPTNTVELQPTTPPVEPLQPESVEIPVLSVPTVDIPAGNTDKYTQVIELLNNNGINYKSYSNDNGHCIIIEI